MAHPQTGLAAAALVGLVAACSDAGGGGDASTDPPNTDAPYLFIADQADALTGTRHAVRAVVDAGTIWLLDANGDFVLDARPATNWNGQTGLTLAWRQVPGAASYKIMVANTATAPTAWQDLKVIPAPDANLNPTVVAKLVEASPWTLGLGTGGYPWSFGNHLQFAVASLDDKDPPNVIDVSGLLETSDDFPGVLTGIEIDPTLPAPFDARVERGATFAKAIRLNFSEPMITTAPPALTSQSANVTIRNVNAWAWGDAASAPSATPLSAALHAFLSLQLSVKGACSELLVARSAGDRILQVRDTSFFSADAGGPAQRLLLLDSSDGTFMGEAVGVDTVDVAAGRITLVSPLVLAPGKINLPSGALVCALSGNGATLALFDSATDSSVTVDDARPFYVGEPVVIYEPQTAGAGEISDVRTLTGVDTSSNLLMLSEPAAAGHTSSGSVVVPLNRLGTGAAGEVALRPSVMLALTHDVIGGPGSTELFVTFDGAPANVMVGDTVLIDADGDLTTTPDQAQATVTQVKFATTPYSIVADLPASMTLLHGQAKVIGLGDCFGVGGTRDTSASAVTPLDRHRDQFSADGLLF